ncbi:hypothetical protein B0H12DRAFT_1237913 [Mycena haematopus]|nr:hypothetical protein B0H12DRAFT_1237913 [Mycena haematopus]
MCGLVFKPQRQDQTHWEEGPPLLQAYNALQHGERHPLPTYNVGQWWEENLVPLRINTIPKARRIVRENSDHTGRRVRDPPSSHPRTSIPRVTIQRYQFKQLRRMIASPEPIDITSTNRDHAQKRIPDVPRVHSPQSGPPHTRARTPAAISWERQPHMTAFLIPHTTANVVLHTEHVFQKATPLPTYNVGQWL